MTNAAPLTPAEVHEDQHFPHIPAADRVDAGVDVAHNVLVARQIPLQDRQPNSQHGPTKFTPWNTYTERAEFSSGSSTLHKLLSLGINRHSGLEQT